MRWGEGGWRWVGGACGKGWGMLYVDVCGFGAQTGQQEDSKLFINFQNGFAYFVGPDRSHMGPYVPIWTLMGPFVKNLLSA